MDGVFDELDLLRDDASFFTKKRRKDGELYAILARCLHFCETHIFPETLDAMKEHVIQRMKDAGRKRVYFEEGADVYLVVGRYVFEGTTVNRAATWRYTATLREAAKRQIRGHDLADWLAENGGINALFKTRPVEARDVTTKTLNLTTPITVPKGEEFCLTLRALPTGFMEVVASPS